MLHKKDIRPLSGLDIKTIQDGVYSHMSKIKCAYFNKQGVKEDEIDGYISTKKNIELLYKSLPERILGITMVVENTDTKQLPPHKLKRIYFIVVNQNLDEKRKSFTILHELGHVLLHKDILKAGSVLTNLKTRKDNFSYENYGLCYEAEANIFAIIQLIPDKELIFQDKSRLLTEEEIIEQFNVNRRLAQDRLRSYRIRYPHKFGIQPEEDVFSMDSMVSFNCFKEELTKPEYPFLPESQVSLSGFYV